MEYTTENIEKFVKVWLAANSKDEIVSALGISSQEVDHLASKLRKFGVELPRLTRSKYALSTDVVNSLNSLIKK